MGLDSGTCSGTCPTYSFKLLATFIGQQDLKTSIDRFVSYSNTFNPCKSADFPIPIEFSKEHLSSIEAAQIQFSIQLLTCDSDFTVFLSKRPAIMAGRGTIRKSQISPKPIV